MEDSGQGKQHVVAIRNARKRQVTRSKGGCRTCKTRRVKCDEGKPHCNRCKRAGYQCGGYTFSLERLPVQTSALTQLLPQPGQITIASCPTDILGSSQYSRTFDFFLSRTIPMLSGHFDVDFWRRMLLQITHAEPTVWHSALALGALHEEYLAGGEQSRRLDLVKQRRYALQHYNEALSRLTQPLPGDQGSVNMMLASCVLFACLENLLGHVSGAIKHMHGGISIIRSYVEDAKKGRNNATAQHSAFIQETFSPILNHFHQFAYLYGTIVIAQAPMIMLRPANERTVNKPFSGIQEANDILREVHLDGRKLLAQYYMVPKSVRTDEWKQARNVEMNDMKRRVPQWLTSFEVLMKSPKMSKPTYEEIQAAVVLRMQQKLTTTWIFNVSGNDQMCYDAFVRNYAALVSLAETSLETREKISYTNYSLQMPEIVSLFVTVFKCRNPIVRRRALTVLKISPKRGGFWDSRLVIYTAEKIIEYEEKGTENMTDSTGSLVPDEWARIVYMVVNPELDEKGRTVVSYTRHDHGRPDDWVYKEDRIFLNEL